MIHNIYVSILKWRALAFKQGSLVTWESLCASFASFRSPAQRLRDNRLPFAYLQVALLIMRPKSLLPIPYKSGSANRHEDRGIMRPARQVRAQTDVHFRLELGNPTYTL